MVGLREIKDKGWGTQLLRFFVRVSHFDFGLTFYPPPLTRYVPLNAILFWVLLLAAGYITLQFEIRRRW